MEMQGGSYGIFGGEIEPVLRRIRRHDDVSAIEATPCPCCGAHIRVCFYPDGHFFHVLCTGSPPHLSVLQDTSEPPPWWTERIIEPVESIVSYFRESEQDEA